MSNAQLSLSDGNGNVSSRGPPLVQLTNGSGQLELTPAGAAGALTGTVSLNTSGATLSGTLGLQINTTTQAVTIGSNPVIPAGPYLLLSGTNDSLKIGQQTIAGDFTFSVSTSGGVATTTLAIANASATIGDGTTTYLALHNGSGSLTISSAGIAGSLAATVDSANTHQSALSLAGATGEIAVNTTSAAVGDIPAGPYVALALNGASLTVGSTTLTGDFAFQLATDAGAIVVTLAATNVALTLGGGIASLTNGSGIVVFRAGSAASVVATLSGTINVNVPGVTVAGTLSVSVNTTGAAYNETLTLGGKSVPVSVPGGTGGYIAITGTGIVVTVLGQSLSGDVTVATGSTAGTLSLTLANLVLKLGGTADAPLVTVSQTGNGSFILSSHGITGSIGVSVTVNGVPGLSFLPLPQNVGFTLDVNTDSTQGPRYLRVDPGPFDFTLAGVTVHADTVVLQQAAAADGSPVIELGVTGGSVTLAGGVTISGISGALEVGRSGVAGTLTATLSAASFGLLNVTGALAVNTSAQAVNDTLTAGGTSIALNLPGGPYFSVELDNAVLGISPSAFTGSTTSGGTQITGVTGTTPTIGQYVIGAGITLGTTVTAVSGQTLTLSQAATADRGERQPDRRGHRAHRQHQLPELRGHDDHRRDERQRARRRRLAHRGLGRPDRQRRRNRRDALRHRLRRRHLRRAERHRHGRPADQYDDGDARSDGDARTGRRWRSGSATARWPRAVRRSSRSRSPTPRSTSAASSPSPGAWRSAAAPRSPVTACRSSSARGRQRSPMGRSTRWRPGSSCRTRTSR